jgi:hypothetical protein
LKVFPTNQKLKERREGGERRGREKNTFSSPFEVEKLNELN